jgi:hypothetical protein
MAFEAPGYHVPALTASADLSDKQHRFVKISGAKQVNVCSVAGEHGLGVLRNTPASGGEASVCVSGVVKVKAGEVIGAGDFVGTKADGKAQVIQHTNSGADTGSWILGIALEAAGAEDELIPVLLCGPVGYRVTA